MDGGWWGEIMSEGQHSAPNMIRPEWDNPQRPRRPTEAPPNTANSPSHKYGSELKHNHQSSQIEGEKAPTAAFMALLTWSYLSSWWEFPQPVN